MKSRTTLLLRPEMNEKVIHSQLCCYLWTDLYMLLLYISLLKPRFILMLCLLLLLGTCHKVSESWSGLEQWIPCMTTSMIPVVLTAVSMS